jgi:hypothetical protein
MSVSHVFYMHQPLLFFNYILYLLKYQIIF